MLRVILAVLVEPHAGEGEVAHGVAVLHADAHGAEGVGEAAVYHAELAAGAVGRNCRAVEPAAEIAVVHAEHALAPALERDGGVPPVDGGKIYALHPGCGAGSRVSQLKGQRAGEFDLALAAQGDGRSHRQNSALRRVFAGLKRYHVPGRGRVQRLAELVHISSPQPLPIGQRRRQERTHERKRQQYG